MKVACLQFGPSLGWVERNIDRANALLEPLKPGQVDLLVLPEMAFSGYNFPNVGAIRPYLEPTTAGITTQWAIATARRLQCIIIVGYPEHCTTAEGGSRNYNSTVSVSTSGSILSNYRKSFLYYTDETWASEGPNGSANLYSPSDMHKPFFCGPLGKLGNVGHGICMDINPYQFTAPWTDYEFANTMLREGVRIVVLSMAWLTRLLPQELMASPGDPDMETVAYWLERFHPLIDKASKDEIIVVFANRCGIEGNVVGAKHVENGEEVEEGDRVCYAGSSCVMRFQGGTVKMYDRGHGIAILGNVMRIQSGTVKMHDRGHGVAILGKGEEGVLVVDTAQVRRDQVDFVLKKGC